MTRDRYLSEIVDGLWKYRALKFGGLEVFDAPVKRGIRPPVFLKGHELRNVTFEAS